MTKVPSPDAAVMVLNTAYKRTATDARKWDITKREGDDRHPEPVAKTDAVNGKICGWLTLRPRVAPCTTTLYRVKHK